MSAIVQSLYHKRTPFVTHQKSQTLKNQINRINMIKPYKQ